MKARVAGPDLTDALSWAAKSVGARATLPVLSGVRLDADDDGLTVTGTDLERVTRQRIDADVAEPGHAIVPASAFAGFAKHAADDAPVDLTVTDDRLAAATRHGDVDLALLASEDWPATPEPESEPALVDGLAEALATAVTCASTNDHRPVLCGVHIAPTDDGLRVAASDSYKASVRYLTGSVARAFLLRADSAKVAAKDDANKIAVDGVRATLDAGNRRLTALGIEGDFPPLEQFRPDAEPATVVTLDVAELERACHIAAVPSDRREDGGHALMLDVHGDGAVVCTTGGSDRGTGTAPIPSAEVDGDAMQVGFGDVHLLPAARAGAVDGRVRLSLIDSTKAMLFTPEGGEDRWALAMPHRL